MKTAKLYVFHDDNSVFSDISDEMFSYATEPVAIQLDASQDYLYVGYRKPINAFYVEMANTNSVANVFDGEYYNGTAWTDLVGLSDFSSGFKRSGFITWDRNQTDEAATTVNSQEAFWYRFRPSVTHNIATTIQGLNIVFSDDNDLREEIFQVDDFLDEDSGEFSFILKHVAARNEIIQKLRNDGKFKHNLTAAEFRDIDAFDLLDYDQLRQASKMLVLSKLYFNASDNPEDHYMDKSDRYRKMYNDMVNLFYLEIDKDDDGIKDTNEQLAAYGSNIVRR